MSQVHNCQLCIKLICGSLPRGEVDCCIMTNFGWSNTWRGWRCEGDAFWPEGYFVFFFFSQRGYACYRMLGTFSRSAASVHSENGLSSGKDKKIYRSFSMVIQSVDGLYFLSPVRQSLSFQLVVAKSFKCLVSRAIRRRKRKNFSLSKCRCRISLREFRKSR